LRARGLFGNSERDLVIHVLQEAEFSIGDQQKFHRLVRNSRDAKDKLVKAERKLEKRNMELLAVLKRANQSKSIDNKLRFISSRIANVLRTTEQNHRVRQVRAYIEKNILAEIA
ncbi:MAG: hypothetical protein HY327_03430, partial [Chloroflexi bacterium]|nr:hypothetical protein [Chloroflexota bacterium]